MSSPKNVRAAAPRTFKRFQRDDRRAFAERQTVAPRIEGAADRGRERLQGIEAGKNHFTQRIIAAGEHALGLAGSESNPRHGRWHCRRRRRRSK